MVGPQSIFIMINLGIQSFHTVSWSHRILDYQGNITSESSRMTVSPDEEEDGGDGVCRLLALLGAPASPGRGPNSGSLGPLGRNGSRLLQIPGPKAGFCWYKLVGAVGIEIYGGRTVSGGRQIQEAKSVLGVTPGSGLQVRPVEYDVDGGVNIVHIASGRHKLAETVDSPR
jgi:hypothetical protein